MISRTSIALLLLCLTACGGRPSVGGSPDLQVATGGALPPPTRSDIINERPYLIGPFDKLNVDVFGVEDLSKEVQADASGRISLPLIGVLEAAGKTPEELAQTIAGKLRGYVRSPQVIVNLKETVSQVITVEGQVRKPGLYPVIGRMTLLRAVATAEGTTDFARLNEVVIFRTVNGQDMAALFDLKAVRRGQYPDPEVYANDVVMVGDSSARRLFVAAAQLAPAIFTPLTVLLQR